MSTQETTHPFTSMWSDDHLVGEANARRFLAYRDTKGYLGLEVQDGRGARMTLSHAQTEALRDFLNAHYPEMTL